MGGSDINDIYANAKHNSGESSFWMVEVLSGTFNFSNAMSVSLNNTVADEAYGSVLIVDPSVDISKGYNYMFNNDIPAKLMIRSRLRFEGEGVTKISKVNNLAATLDSLPTIWVPNVNKIDKADAFGSSEIEAIYLPKLTSISSNAFRSCAVQHLILADGSVPSVSAPVFNDDQTLTVWVPVSKEADYFGSDDGDTSDHKWYGFDVRTYPDEAIVETDGNIDAAESAARRISGGSLHKLICPIRSGMLVRNTKRTSYWRDNSQVYCRMMWRRTLNLQIRSRTSTHFTKKCSRYNLCRSEMLWMQSLRMGSHWTIKMSSKRCVKNILLSV